MSSTTVGNLVQIDEALRKIVELSHKATNHVETPVSFHVKLTASLTAVDEIQTNLLPEQFNEVDRCLTQARNWLIKARQNLAEIKVPLTDDCTKQPENTDD